MRVTRTQRVDRWFVLAAVVALTCFYVVLGSRMIPLTYDHDFMAFHGGAALAFDRGLYDVDRQTARQQEALPGPGRPVVPFVRPVWYAWLLRPLSWLSYDQAFWTWIGIQCAILAWCWWRAWRRFGDVALLLCAAFFPPPMGIASGQDSAVLLLLVLEAFLALEKKRWTTTGILLALTLVKWHLLILVPVALVLNRQWRVFRAWVGTAIVLAAACLLDGGLPSYYALLTRNDLVRLAPSKEMMVNLEAIAINFGVPWLWIPLAVVVLGVALWAIYSAPAWRWFSIAIAASLLLPPHVYKYDAAVLLPAILCAVTVCRSIPVRIAGFCAAMPFAFLLPVAGWPWSMAPALVLFALFVALVWDRRSTGATEPQPDQFTRSRWFAGFLSARSSP